MSRRGVSTIVGALAALPAFIILALILLGLAAQTALEAARARERVEVIPVVDGGVGAELLSNERSVVKYIVVRDLDAGTVDVIPGPFIVEPGQPFNVTLLPQAPSQARLDVAVVTERGNVFRWSPEYTGGDFILDIPGEPSPPGGAGGLSQLGKLELWLIQNGFYEPAICSLSTYWLRDVNPLTAQFTFTVDASAAATALFGSATASASVDGVSDSGGGPSAFAQVIYGGGGSVSLPQGLAVDSITIEATAYADATSTTHTAQAALKVTVAVRPGPGYSLVGVDYGGGIVRYDTQSLTLTWGEGALDSGLLQASASVSRAQGDVATLTVEDPTVYALLLYKCP